MGDLVQQMLVRPIQLADQVLKASDEAAINKQECSQIKAKTERLAALLRRAVHESSDLYERPARRIINDAENVLGKALVLVKRCRYDGYMRLFNMIPAAAFRKMISQLENSGGDVSWLLRVSTPAGKGDDDDEGVGYLGLPLIAFNEPILYLIWEQIAILTTGSVEDKSDAAAALASCAKNSRRFVKIIVEEGGVSPLLKLLKEGKTEGQENAAKLIGLLGQDPESVEQMIQLGVCSVLASILKEGSMRVQAVVAWAVSELVSVNHTKCQELFAQNNVIRLLVSHLAFETVQEVIMASEVTSSSKNLPALHEDEEEDNNQIGVSMHIPNKMQSIVSTTMAMKAVPSSRFEEENPLAKAYNTSHQSRNASVTRGRELEDPATKAYMKAMAARALWKLAVGNATICRVITESRALLCFAVLLEKGDEETMYYTAMAIMEITAVAEENSDLRRSAFRRTSPACKAVVDQLFRIVETADAGSDLLIPCVRSIGNLARTFKSAETHMIVPLIKLLDNNEPDLAVEVGITLEKFASNGKEATHVIYIYCTDTLRYSFGSHLSMEFRQKGIYATVNYNGSLEVIEKARVSVVVLSKNFLSSTPCLLKLMAVLKWQRKNDRVVVPVFYDISDVAMSHYESEIGIREWSSALQELRELPGHQFREGCSECELVEEIVKDVYGKIFPMEQIGINSRLSEIERLLCKQPWGIRCVGIWGMPGIGKTSLAKVFFDQIARGYETSCFIENFDTAFHEKGLHRLLGKHFGDILKKMPSGLTSVIKPSLRGDIIVEKRTLVVLDDVQTPLFAESFLGGLHWFGPGSVIIITSRNKKVFRHCQINHLYEVQSLNENEALKLFSQCAFGKDIIEPKLLKLSREVNDYANGNPLILKFYSETLKGKKSSEMEARFLKQKLQTLYNLPGLCKRSYDTLDKIEKKIFLDIACFFKGEDIDYVMQLLEGCGFFPHVGINVLVEKCFLTISEKRVNMHNLIQDFGREINNQETGQIERRRRLWEPLSIKLLLEDNPEGTEDIEGIFMDTSNLIIDVKPGAFNDMFNLRFLKIYSSSYENNHGLGLPKGLESLPCELRLLHWENYPLQSLPRDFDPCHLVQLNMPNSQLQKLWADTNNLKMLNLKMVRLSHSQQLTEIDDISKAENVELIDLQGCTKLKSVPAMCQLQRLRVLIVSGCRDIKSFPEVSPNIEELHLQGTGIKEIPISSVTLSQQAKLNRDLSNLLTGVSGGSNALNVELLASLVKTDSASQHLGKLGYLNMKGCFRLRSLPDMADLESLQVLNISGCSKLEHVQGLPRNLKELYLGGSAIKELPQLPQSLEILNAHGCVSLVSIPFGLEHLPKYCTFTNCISLSTQVVSEYLKNYLAYMERTTREYHKELNKFLEFSLSILPAETKSAFHLQPGNSVLIQLSPTWRSTFVAFVILVECAFSEDFSEATAFGFKCVCRWKDKEGLSHRLEETFHCWTREEQDVQKFQNEHMFAFCDLNLHPSSSTDILADLLIFEIFPVNKETELLDNICTVKRCGVYAITAENGATSLNRSQTLLSSKVLPDCEAEDVLWSLKEKDRSLFLYIACLFNDEEADLIAPHIASIGLGISSGMKVLADNSLVCISTFGVIVQHYLLRTMGREIVRRQPMMLDSLEIENTTSVHSGKLVGIKDHVADMSSLPNLKSLQVKTVEMLTSLIKRGAGGVSDRV